MKTLFVGKKIKLPPHQEQQGEGRWRLRGERGGSKYAESTGKGREGKEGERGQTMGMGEGRGGKGQ